MNVYHIGTHSKATKKTLSKRSGKVLPSSSASHEKAILLGAPTNIGSTAEQYSLYFRAI